MYLKRARDKMLGIVKQICYNRTFPIWFTYSCGQTERNWEVIYTQIYSQIE